MTAKEGRMSGIEKNPVTWQRSEHHGSPHFSRCGVMEFDSFQVGKSVIIHADCFHWLKQAEENSIHAVVTDPPYGLKEYEEGQIQKKDSGSGGVWRIPPAFDGHKRSPVLRFTALTTAERMKMVNFFREWAKFLSES
jgi:site-specific DNA-methyltransferase (adenine-specific)